MKLWKKFKEIDKEIRLSGVAGAVAIIAIIFEMAIADFDSASIAGGIKDIAGTIIAVVMLIIAISALRPKKPSEFSFEAALRESLKAFAESNGRMISIKDESEGNTDYYEMYMQSDSNAYFGDAPKLQAGWFLRMPPIKNENYANENVRIEFHLNRGTFFGHNKPNNEAEAFKAIGSQIEKLVLRENTKSLLKCQYYDKTIGIEFTNPLTTEDDVKMIVGLVQKIYVGYLTLGGLTLKTDESKN